MKAIRSIALAALAGLSPTLPATAGTIGADTIFRDGFDPRPVLVTTALPALHVLETYAATLAANSGTPPYTWQIEGLPAGLIVDADAGTIAGDPADPAISTGGPLALTVTVTDANGYGDESVLPLDVIGVARISLGDGYTCAVSAAGRGYCWGRNDEGQLGNGASSPFGTANPLPTAIVDPTNPTLPLEGLAKIAAGHYHTCAVTTDDTAYCWGWGAGGRLGNGGTDSSLVPVPVVDPSNPTQPLGGVTGIDVGQSFACASTTSGIAYCWGNNFYGQLGNNVPGESLMPSAVVDPNDTSQPLAGLVQIATGTFHTCAVTASGGAWCWGWNTAGQLGNNTTRPGQFPTPLPQRVVDPADPKQPFAGVVHISGGNVHTCALTAGANAYCWGLNNYGQLGNGNMPANSSVPSPVVDPAAPGQPLADMASVDAGGLHSCAVTAAGNAMCWGSNDTGQLGNGDTADSAVPVAVVDPLDPTQPFAGVAQVNARGSHACAVSNDGIAYCWGRNETGELGDGTTEPRPTPAPVHPGS